MPEAFNKATDLKGELNHYDINVKNCGLYTS